MTSPVIGVTYELRVVSAISPSDLFDQVDLEPPPQVLSKRHPCGELEGPAPPPEPRAGAVPPT